MNNLSCYLFCIQESGMIYPLLLTLFLAILCLFAYFRKRRHEFLLANQTFMIWMIASSILTMECTMFNLIWAYLGIVIICTLLLGIVKLSINLRHSNLVRFPIGIISTLEEHFSVVINVLDSQKIKAYTHRGEIYLSIGLMERLEPDEIMAVVAHEVYHLRKSPSKFVLSVLALISFTFLRHSDEYHADRFAADISGVNNLKNALRKLDVKDYSKRIKQLS